jgi:hypothetical protein
MSVFNQLLTRPLDIIQTQYNLIVCNEKKITSNVTKDQVPDFRKQRLSKKKSEKGSVVKLQKIYASIYYARKLAQNERKIYIIKIEPQR